MTANSGIFHPQEKRAPTAKELIADGLGFGGNPNSQSERLKGKGSRVHYELGLREHQPQPDWEGQFFSRFCTNVKY